MRTTLAVLATLGLLVTACSPDDEAAETTTTTTTIAPSATSTSIATTTTTSRATTTTVSADRSLINGLPVADTDLLDRRVLAVKIDNHPRANPQSGLEEADMVIEVLVEGITRYLTIWHESDSEYLGPMRSGRPTDGSLLAAFDEPTFALSGAQDWVQRVIVSKDVHLIGEVGSPQTFRVSGRSAPHNLYVNTLALREYADGRGYTDDPPDRPLWSFGPMPDLAEPATEVNIDFSGNTVIWNWDTETGMWLRTGLGVESTYLDPDGNELRIGIPVMVALYVEQYTASPPGGVSGSSVPASRTTGSGTAFVFADGSVTEGTWERESETDWFMLTDANGEIMMVPPGKVWVSLVPAHRGLSYR